MFWFCVCGICCGVFSPLFLSVFPLSRPLSRWTCASRYQNVSILDFIAAKGDGGDGDNWSYKTRKAPVKMSPPTNQHPVFRGPMPFVSPNQQCQSTKGKCCDLSSWCETMRERCKVMQTVLKTLLWTGQFSMPLVVLISNVCIAYVK